MTKKMRRQLAPSGGVASSALLNALTIAAIDSRVEAQIAGVEVDPSCGLRPAGRLAAMSKYKGLGSGISSPQRAGRKRYRHQRSKSTINKELVSPIKRQNSINDKIIMEELKYFNCHKSIWSQRTKNELGQGLIIPPPHYESRLRKGDGDLVENSCTICRTGSHTHRPEVSRQCGLHCVSRAMNIPYVMAVREHVVVSFACKTTAVIDLLIKWHNITTGDLNAVGSGSTTERATAKKTIRQKLNEFKHLLVPKNPGTCSGTEGWLSEDGHPVCVLGFAMMTGIQPYRVRLARDCIYNGQRTYVSKSNQRALRIDAMPRDKVIRRYIWVSDWLVDTLRDIVQTHANGQKRVQDAKYPTATALARACITAFWNMHPELTSRREVAYMQKVSDLKLLSESKQNVEADSTAAVAGPLAGLHSVSQYASGTFPKPTIAVAMPVRDHHQLAYVERLRLSDGRPVSSASGPHSDWKAATPLSVSSADAGSGGQAAAAPLSSAPGPQAPHLSSASGAQAPPLSSASGPPAPPLSVASGGRQAAHQAWPTMMLNVIEEPRLGDVANDGRLLYLAPLDGGAMNADVHSVAAVNRVAGLMQTKPKRSKSDKEIEEVMQEAQGSGIEPGRVMGLVDQEYESHAAVGYGRPLDSSSAQVGGHVDDDQGQDEVEAVLEYSLNFQRFSRSLPSALALIDESVPKAGIVRQAMTEAETEMKRKSDQIVMKETDRKRREVRDEMKDQSGRTAAEQELANIWRRSKTNPFVTMALKMDEIMRNAQRSAGNLDSRQSTCLGLAASMVMDKLCLGPMQQIEKSLPKELRQLHMKTVLKIIRDNHGELDFPQACDLGTCVDCDFFTRALGKRDRDVPNSSVKLGKKEEEAYNDLRARELLHRTEHIAERGAFAERQARVINNPKKYIMVVADYSKSIFIPKYVRGNKEEMEHQQLEIKIAAIIVYANGRRYNYIFLHDATLPKGSNTMLSAMYSVIRYHKSFGDAQQADTLYFQVDGGVENVSFTPFGFHDFMVRHGWFKRVELYRLPVGHSHQLIDAFFSAIARAYRKGNMATVAAIIKRLNETWDGGTGATPEDKVWMQITRPQFVWLNHVMDFGTLFRPHMNVISGMRARVLGWLFERTDDGVDAKGFYDVNLWYMVSPALDTRNGHSWRGCNGIEKDATGQVARPIKLFDQSHLNRVDIQDPRTMAPGNMKLSKDFLCKTRARTLEVRQNADFLFLLIILILVLIAFGHRPRVHHLHRQVSQLWR